MNKNTVGFFLLMVFVAFILGQVIGPANSAPLTDEQMIERDIDAMSNTIDSMFKILRKHAPAIIKQLNQMERDIEKTFPEQRKLAPPPPQFRNRGQEI